LSYPSFERAAEVVSQFIKLLAEHSINLHQGGAAEGEALAMIDVLDTGRPRLADRSAMSRKRDGFVELAGKVVGVKDHPDFGQSASICKCSAKRPFYTRPDQ